LKDNLLRDLVDRAVPENPAEAHDIMAVALNQLPKSRQHHWRRWLLLAAVLLLMAVPTGFLVYRNSQHATPNTGKLSPIINWSQADFYRGSRQAATAGGSGTDAMAQIGPPIETFDDFINASSLTFLGTVTQLRGFVQSNHPYTIATLYVNQVLTGDPNQQGQSVNVMFSGGNITKAEMMAPVAMKPWVDQEAIHSNEIVTLDNGDAYLPIIGQHLAIILGKTEKAAPPFNVPFAWPIMEGRGVFNQEADGIYRQRQLIMPFGGDSGVRIKDTQRPAMTAGMQALIKAKTDLGTSFPVR